MGLFKNLIQMSRWWVVLVLVGLSVVLGQGQNAFILLDDPIDIDRTERLSQLDTTAQRVINLFPENSTFRNEFKIFDFGFSVHHEDIKEGYPQAIERIRSIVEAQAPYYLIFGKESNEFSAYERFWIDLKLPAETDLPCFTEAKRQSIQDLIEKEVNKIHEENKKNPFRTYEAEIAGMKVLEHFLDKLINCCPENSNARSNQCEYCFYTPEQQIDLLKGKGMLEIAAEDLTIEVAEDAAYDNPDFETQHSIKVTRAYGDNVVHWNFTDKLNNFLPTVSDAKARVLYFDDITCPNFEDYIDGKYPERSTTPSLGNDSSFFEEIIILKMDGKERMFFKFEGTDQSETSILWTLEHLAAVKRGGLLLSAIYLEVEECIGGFNNWLETWIGSKMFSNNWDFLKAAWEVETGAVGVYGWSYNLPVEIGEYLSPSGEPSALRDGVARSTQSMAIVELIGDERGADFQAIQNQRIIQEVFAAYDIESNTNAIRFFENCKTETEILLESYNLGINQTTNFDALPRTYFTPTGELFALTSFATAEFFFCNENFPDGTLKGFITEEGGQYHSWTLIEDGFLDEEAPAKKFGGYAKRGIYHEAENRYSPDYASFIKSERINANRVYIGRISGNSYDTDYVEQCIVSSTASTYDNCKEQDNKKRCIKKKSELPTVASSLSHSPIIDSNCEKIEHPTCKDDCKVKYADHPYIKYPCTATDCDPIRRVFAENPCLIATLEHHEFETYPQTEFMKELGNIVFYMVGSALTIPVITTTLPTIIEEIGRQGATRFAGGALIDALLQSSIHYYFPQDGTAITWEVARSRIDWKQATASGVENMIDLNSAVGNALVSGAFSCGVDGWLENGEVRDDFNWRKCGIGALSAVFIQGIFSGSGALYRHLKEMPAEQFMEGVARLLGDIYRPQDYHLNGAGLPQPFQEKMYWLCWKAIHGASPTPDQVKGLFKIDDEVIAQQVSDALASNPTMVKDLMEGGFFAKLASNETLTRTRRADLMKEILTFDDATLKAIINDLENPKILNIFSSHSSLEGCIGIWKKFKNNEKFIPEETYYDLMEELDTKAFSHNYDGWGGCTSGARVFSSIPDGSFIIGGFGPDLKYILPQFPSATIGDPDKFLQKDLDELNDWIASGFPKPTSSKLNLLNVKDPLFFYIKDNPDKLVTFTKYNDFENNPFFIYINGPWMDAAVAQNAPIIVASNLNEFLYDAITNKITGFGKEIHRLEWIHNYRYDSKTKQMLPAGEVENAVRFTKELDYNHGF